MVERRKDLIDFREFIESKIRTEETFIHMKETLVEINTTLKEIAAAMADEKTVNEARHTKSETNIRWIKRVGISGVVAGIGKLLFY